MIRVKVTLEMVRWLLLLLLLLLLLQLFFIVSERNKAQF